MNLKRLLALHNANFIKEINKMSHNELVIFDRDVKFNISVGIIPEDDYPWVKQALVTVAMED